MKISKILSALVLLFIFGACSTPQNIAYMQGLHNEQTRLLREQKRITVQSDDKLSIVVSSKDPVLAEVFNLAIAQHRVGNDNTNNQFASAYTVTSEGYIKYPIIGEIYIAGLSRNEVSNKIEEALIQKNLLKDPIVTVEFLNASVSVLGDVAKPGEYSIDKDNLTILQALSKAGDLNITGRRDNVLVLRNIDGVESSYRINLTDTTSIMNSPAYYIKQNDVIYVEPNNTKKRQANANGNTVLTPTFWMSVVSLLTTITALILK